MFTALDLFVEVATAEQSRALSALCEAQGIHRAVEVGVLSDTMQTQLLKAAAEPGELAEPLRVAVTRARGLIKGWATGLTVFGGGGGSGRVPAVSQSPSSPVPGSAEPPALVQADPGPVRAAGGAATPVARTSRLLRVFTLRTIKGGKSKRGRGTLRKKYPSRSGGLK